jgi:putative oxidoreductase
MIGLPAAMAIPIGLLEVIGGIAVLVGILTRVSAILFIMEMFGSILIANLPKVGKGFVGVSFSLLLTGPGRVSIEGGCNKERIVS